MAVPASLLGALVALGILVTWFVPVAIRAGTPPPEYRARGRGT